MNTSRNWAGATIALLLFALVCCVAVVAQSSKSIPRLAAGASIRQDADDKDQRQECCLQTGTGQRGWTLVSAPRGVHTPHAAVILRPPNPSYAPALPGSTWVGPTAGSGVDDLPVGSYVYEFKFCICREKKEQHPILSLLLFSDNETTAVTLNGGPNLISPTPAVSFANPPGPFPVIFPGSVVPHGVGTFRPCPEINTLAITVNNDGGPTGLDAILSVTGASASADGDCDCRD